MENHQKHEKIRATIQPIVPEDNSLAVKDEEIFQQLKLKYGKENFNVKTSEPLWFQQVEDEVVSMEKIEREQLRGNEGKYEEMDITVDEVEAAIKSPDVKSAPSPSEKIFGIMLTKGGDIMVDIPKPGKNDYNTSKYYRQITLKSIIGKLMERIVKRHLVWKLEVENSKNTQNAYHNNWSCTRTLMRAVQYY